MQDIIIERLQHAVGLQREAAGRVATAIIRALAEQLPAADRSTFAGKVAIGIAPGALRAAGAPSDSLPHFYRRIASLTGLPEVRAIEAAQVVCAALGGALEPDSRVWVAARLPAAIASLLSPREVASPAPEAPHGQRRYPTLAESRPGSTHPLSEAHPERAHHESIACSDNPHGDTKLASSPGPSQAGKRKALAEGDPRPSRPLGSGRQ